MTIETDRPAAVSLGAFALSAVISVAAAISPAQAQSGNRAIDAFANSRYTYCDAKLIGALMGTSIYRGKVTIGQKILNGIGSNMPVVLAESRANGNRCEWEDTGFTYEDAEVLADIWGLSTPYQAKLKVARYATNGQTRIVNRALGF